MGYYLLNGEWDLREESLSTNINEYNRVVSEKVDWLIAQVPGDIHQALLQASKIHEPLEELNSFKTEWVEERSWVF